MTETIILKPDDSGPSTWGIHKWLSYLACPVAYGGPGGKAVSIGSLFHQMMEVYYTHPTGNYVLQSENSDDFISSDSSYFSEAKALYNRWTARYPRDELGEVLGAEVPLEAEDFYGVPNFSGKLDILFRLNEEQAEKFELNRMDAGPTAPGVYFADFKTTSFVSRAWHIEQLTRLQYTGYAELLRAKRPDLADELRGSFVLGLGKVKVPQEKHYPTIFIPLPDDKEKARLRRTLELCRRIKETEGDFKNPTQCVGKYGVCRRHHSWEDGDCEG